MVKVEVHLKIGQIPSSTLLYCLLHTSILNFGEIVFNESDVCDLIMQGRDIDSLNGLVVDPSINIEELAHYIEHPESLLTWTFPHNAGTSVPEFHASLQMAWHMPDEYKQLDIAQYILNLCNGEAELQRCGQELLLYQERNLTEHGVNLLMKLVILLQKTNIEKRALTVKSKENF
mgnify:CR=1 FL=1